MNLSANARERTRMKYLIIITFIWNFGFSSIEMNRNMNFGCSSYGSCGFTLRAIEIEWMNLARGMNDEQKRFHSILTTRWTHLIRVTSMCIFFSCLPRKMKWKHRIEILIAIKCVATRPFFVDWFSHLTLTFILCLFVPA